MSKKSFICELFALQLGSTAIGIQTNEGVVLAVEKRVTSPLIEPSSIEKVLEVDDHIGTLATTVDTKNVLLHVGTAVTVVDTPAYRYSGYCSRYSCI